MPSRKGCKRKKRPFLRKFLWSVRTSCFPVFFKAGMKKARRFGRAFVSFYRAGLLQLDQQVLGVDLVARFDVDRFDHAGFFSV